MLVSCNHKLCHSALEPAWPFIPFVRGSSGDGGIQWFFVVVVFFCGEKQKGGNANPVLTAIS
jgi:hypothetical protein